MSGIVWSKSTDVLKNLDLATDLMIGVAVMVSDEVLGRLLIISLILGYLGSE